MVSSTSTIRQFCLCFMVTAAYGNLQSTATCDSVRTRRDAKLSTPPDIAGSWFSPSCELLPGPQYLLRNYKFSTNGQFTITRYYHLDETCSKAAFAIQAEGLIFPESSSWYLSEATDMNMDVQKVTVKPYTSEMANTIASLIKVGCQKETNWTDTPPYSQVSLNSYDLKCMESLSFSANELLVMRQVDYEVRKVSDTRRQRMTYHVERELQLGSVWFSQVQRPSSYQPPLYDVTHKHCKTCKCIYKADIDNPPEKCDSEWVTIEDSNVSITGQWNSYECESVPSAQFTMRSVYFNTHTNSFQTVTNYYEDAFCTKPTFSLKADGLIQGSIKHRYLHNGNIYKLKFTGLIVQLQSEYMKMLMDLGAPSTCGNISNWTLNEEYDLFTTQGCDSLGITIREADYSLIKVEKKHGRYYILMSELKENEQDFYSKITHFSERLQRCTISSVTNRLPYQQSTQLSIADNSTSRILHNHKDLFIILHILLYLFQSIILHQTNMH